MIWVLEWRYWSGGDYWRGKHGVENDNIGLKIVGVVAIAGVELIE
jgi:hypothetical protein